MLSFFLSVSFATVLAQASGLHFLVPPFSSYKQHEIEIIIVCCPSEDQNFHQFHAVLSQAGCGKSPLENRL